MHNHYLAMKKILVLLALLLASKAILAQKTDKTLTKELSQIIKDFRGQVGIYVEHLGNGKTVAINADSIFPTASMIKVPIMIGVFNKIDRDSLQYHQDLIYKDSLLYPGEDILGSFKEGATIQLSKVMMLMLTMSDNTASLWLQSLAGGGSRINTWLEEHGYKITRVNSRTPGRAANQALYGWGQTSPSEMADLMKRIYKGELINPVTSERMYRNLTRNFWDTEGLAMVPKNIRTASKNGAVNESRSEVIMVNAPSGDYVYCICTKNNIDQSWGRDNEAKQLLRKVALAIWKHFEPGSKQMTGSMAEHF